MYVTPSAWPRGSMVTRSTRPAPVQWPIIAWPASWYARRSRVPSVSRSLTGEISPPSNCVSMARNTWSDVTFAAPFSAALDAALLTMLAMSAGVRPGVMRASAAHRLVDVVLVVGGGDHDDVVHRLEAVHLHQHAVDDAVHLRFRAAAFRAARTLADAVPLVDEQHARRVLARQLEQRLALGDARAVVRGGEVRAVDGDEVGLALAGQRLGEQRLAGARRADQQHAARRGGAQLHVGGRIRHERLDAPQ